MTVHPQTCVRVTSYVAVSEDEMSELFLLSNQNYIADFSVNYHCSNMAILNSPGLIPNCTLKNVQRWIRPVVLCSEGIIPLLLNGNITSKVEKSIKVSKIVLCKIITACDQYSHKTRSSPS